MRRLLTIGDVAVRLGRSVDFVRRLTDEGQLKAEPRGKGKYRHYTEAAVVAYEAKEQRHRPRPQARPRPKPPSPPPMPRRRVIPAVDPGLYPNDDVPWEEQFEPEPPTPPPPRTLSPTERLYLDTLILGGMLHAPRGLPEDWRVKVHAELEHYATIERFPMQEGVLGAPTTIRLHVEAFLAPYREAKKKEEERQRASEAAARAAGDRRQALIRYGHQLVEHELASWAWDDPKDEARREVELVLQAEVKADWDEGKVRRLATELLDKYAEDDDEDGEEEEGDDGSDDEFDD